MNRRKNHDSRNHYSIMINSFDSCGLSGLCCMHGGDEKEKLDWPQTLLWCRGKI